MTFGTGCAILFYMKHKDRRRWAKFRERWSDFFQAALTPTVVFSAGITLLCLLMSLLSFDSSDSSLAVYISPALRLLSTAFSGFTVVAFQKNNNSVIDRESVLQGKRVAVRRVVAAESKIENLSAPAFSRKVSKQELIRHQESLLQDIKLIKDDLSDIVPDDRT